MPQGVPRETDRGSGTFALGADHGMRGVKRSEGDSPDAVAFSFGVILDARACSQVPLTELCPNSAFGPKRIGTCSDFSG